MSTGRTVPDFFVVGAYRSGTTFLYQSLRQHPEVFLPTIKEPNFFAVDDNPTATPELIARSVVDRERYEALYRDAGSSQRTGDMSPEYLRNRSAPGRIHRSHPDAPLVAILRNPVDRVWSDYLMHRSRGTERCESLAQALTEQDDRRAGTDRNAPHYIDAGMYHQQLTRYFEFFGRDQLLVLLYDDLLADPRSVLEKVFTHIGVEPSFEVLIEQGVNAGGVPKNALMASALRIKSKLAPHVRPAAADRLRPLWNRVLRRNLDKPRMTDADRDALRGVYRREVEALEALIGRDLGRWLEET